jgi:hypothetical protein
MNYCMIHGQAYPLGCFCPYCGATPILTTATAGMRACVHQWMEHTGGRTCMKCGAIEPVGGDR